MRCNRCGKPIDQDAHYCPHCGAEIIQETSSKTTDGKRMDLLKEYDTHFLNKPTEKLKRSKKKRLFWLLDFFLILFAVAIVCYSTGMSLPGAEISSQPPATVTVTQSSYYNSSESGKYYIVSVGKGNRLSLRSEPNEYATKLDRIDNETRLYLTEVHNGWGKTTYNNQTGWVCIQNEDGTYCIKE